MKTEQAITKHGRPVLQMALSTRQSRQNKWIGYTRNHHLPPTAQQREKTRCDRTKNIPDPSLPNPLGYQLSELRGKNKGRSARGNYFIRFCKSLLTLKMLNQTQRTHPCAKTFRPPAPRTPPPLGPSKILMIAMKQRRNGKEVRVDEIFCDFPTRSWCIGYSIQWGYDETVRNGEC